MNQREQLIEKAAEAIHDAHHPTTGETPCWDQEQEVWRDTYRAFARAALAVFDAGCSKDFRVAESTPSDDHSDHARCGECAEWPRSTPSDHHVDHHVDHHDDEREALANLIPLGFSERDGVRNVYDAADRILAAGFHRIAQGEPSNVTEPGIADISPAQMSVRGDPSLRDHVRDLTGASDAELDALGGFTGEPSDAQVKAFVTAINASGFVLDRRAVKSGLRAAAAVQGGDHHGNA